MKRVAHLFLFSLLVMASVARVALADDSSRAVTLVATDALEGTPFEQTVIVVARLPNGGHVGLHHQSSDRCEVGDAVSG